MRTLFRFVPLLLVIAACQTPSGDLSETVDAFLERDPSLKKHFDEAYAYAIWPTVGKGGFIVGGGGGRGAVYQGGQLVGFSSITFVTIGAQVGGQEFSEVIFFKDKKAFDLFRLGTYETTAQATAVAAHDGAGTKVDYADGVMIFVLPKGGLMAEASIGGQKFSYEDR